MPSGLPEFLASLERHFHYVNLVLQAVLVARLIGIGLFRRYPAFVSFFCFSLLRSTALLPFDVNSDTYFFVYAATSPLVLATYVLLALEVCGRVLESYRGLSFLGRSTVALVLAISALISLITNGMEMDFSHEPYAYLRLLLLIETTVSKMLLYFLLALALFLLWYPISLRKNILVYSFGCTVLFAAFSAGILLRNLDPDKWARAGSALRLGGYTFCLLFWIVMFRKSGETENRTAGIPYSKAQGERLLSQLEALNSFVEKSRRPGQA